MLRPRHNGTHARPRPEPIGTLRPVRPLGRGGMGEVWLYHDKALGVDRAVKFLLTERAGDPALRARFAAEARTLAALGQTPGIVRVHAAGEIPRSGLPYFVMDAHLLSAAQVRLVCTQRLALPSPAAEAVVRTLAATHAKVAENGSHAEFAKFAENNSHAEFAKFAEFKSHAESAENAESARFPFTLQDALGDEASGTARQLPERTVLRLAREIAAALARLHGRSPPIVHRDLKPANLLFSADGRLLLADFGIAKALDPARMGLTRTGAQPGSHRYAAPEQLDGAPATPASDWYALGVILYRALTSSFPEWGENLFPTSAGLRLFSPRWRPLLLELLAPNPARRLSSPAAFLDRLDRIERSLERPARHAGRAKLAVAATAVALGFAAAVTTCVASRDKAPGHSETGVASPAEPAPPALDAPGGGSGEAEPPPVAPPTTTTTRPPPTTTRPPTTTTTRPPRPAATRPEPPPDQYIETDVHITPVEDMVGPAVSEDDLGEFRESMQRELRRRLPYENPLDQGGLPPFYDQNRRRQAEEYGESVKSFYRERVARLYARVRAGETPTRNDVERTGLDYREWSAWLARKQREEVESRKIPPFPAETGTKEPLP